MIRLGKMGRGWGKSGKGSEEGECGLIPGTRRTPVHLECGKGKDRKIENEVRQETGGQRVEDFWPLEGF